MPYSDPEKRKEYHRKANKKAREKINARMKVDPLFAEQVRVKRRAANKRSYHKKTSDPVLKAKFVEQRKKWKKPDWRKYNKPLTEKQKQRRRELQRTENMSESSLLKRKASNAAYYQRNKKDIQVRRKIQWENKPEEERLALRRLYTASTKEHHPETQKRASKAHKERQKCAVAICRDILGLKISSTDPAKAVAICKHFNFPLE